MRKRLQIDVATKGKFDSIWEKVQRSKLFDRLDTKDRAFLKLLLFGDFCWPYIPLCNMYVEVAARQVMQQLLADWVTKHPERKKGAKRVRMITMLFADQFVDFDQPEVCLDKVKGRIRRLLKALGLHGFVFIEMQPTILPGQMADGTKRRICIHAHGFCWSDNPGFKPKLAIQGLDKTRALKPVFGCDAIKVKALKLQTAESLNKIVSYIGKLTAGVTKVAPTLPGSKRPYRIYSNKDGWTGPMAIRSIELLSLLSVTNLTVATGDASKMRARWKRKLRTQLFCDVTGTIVELDAVKRFWKKAMNFDRKRKAAKLITKDRSP